VDDLSLYARSALAAGLFPGLVIAVRYSSPNTIDARDVTSSETGGRCAPRT